MKQKQLGIGLIEVLVTITITTIGLLGLSAMQMQSIRSVSDSGNRTHAIWIANDLLNRIRANEAAVGTYVTDEIECSDGIPDTPICASHFDGTNQVTADFCTNDQLAVFDQWDSICGISAIVGGDNLMNSSASFINSPGLTITDLGNGDLQITISWNSRTGGSSENDDGDEEVVYFLEEGAVADNQRETYSVVFRP